MNAKRKPTARAAAKQRSEAPRHPVVERSQTGVRLEKRLLKVLKGLAEYHDITLGDLLEGICLHAFEGKCAFSKKSLTTINNLKGIYGLDLTAADSHRLVEPGVPRGEK
ncbi:MAG: hypothetical protein AAF581_19810 [Planctomycetota bacterium]